MNVLPQDKSGYKVITPASRFEDGKKLKILLFCSIPPRLPGAAAGTTYADVYDVIGPTHEKYCRDNGYDYYLDVSDIWEPAREDTNFGSAMGKPYPIRYFIKFLLFMHFLDPTSCQKEYDHIVWVDSDWLPTRFDIPIEKYLNSRKGTEVADPQGGDIILSNDVNTLHATVIMMRRTALTLGFAWANYNAGRTYFAKDDWADQLSMKFFLHYPPYCQIVHFHSVQILCAMPPGIYPIPEIARRVYEWNEESFGLHLSALSNPKRIQLAKEYIERLGLL